MTIAWVYCAVSSDRQTETLEWQKKRCEDVARSNGWRIEPGRIFEAPGTGKDGPRAIFEKLMREVRAATVKPQWVIATRLDRISRNKIAESVLYLHELNEMGVRVWTCDSGEENIDDAMREAIVMFKFAIGKRDNEIRRDKAIQGHARRKAAGMHDGNAPYGIALVDGKPRAQEPQANMVRALFEKRARGAGIRALSRYAAAHAPPKRLKNGRISVLKWDKSTVALMLRCQTYRGVVVPEDFFDRVCGMHRFGYFPPSKDGYWPLTGTIRCFCGCSNLTGRMSGRGKWRHRYYVCTAHAGDAVKEPYFRADALEDAFVVFLRRLGGRALDTMPRRADIDTQAKTRINEVQRQLAAVGQRRERAWELAEEGGIASDVLRKRLDEHDEHIRRLTAELESAKADLKHAAARAVGFERASALIARLPDRWPHLEIADRAEVARLLSRELGGIKMADGATSQRMRVELSSPHPHSGEIALQTSPSWGRLADLLAG